MTDATGDAFRRQLGARIRHLRLTHGMTQTRLADAIGVTTQAVNQWENGDTAPTAANLAALTHLLGPLLNGEAA